MIKVASYCRVSTEKADQANSFEAQQRYFREYIEHNPNWELYEIYADEGITGTSTKKRAQFNRMIRDAYRGKFKLIVTKEVSRFSRNILDTIAYTRELKALGIGVIFMSDGFSTLDPDCELRLSIMGSVAQEESRKTSTRVKWGQTRQMERGIVFGHALLGYNVKNGRMTINPEGAEIVRLIFQKYGIEKKGASVIARELQEAGHKTLTGNPKWNNTYILKILKNEKYVGDLVQKKTITPDYLTHSKRYNHGEEPLIIIENHHEAIISRELWNLVQDELKKRNRRNLSAEGHSNRYVFSGKIKCAECGASFVSRVKTRKDGSSYRRWGCFTAAAAGVKKTTAQGNETGCDVGKQIRDDLALDILTEVIRSIPVDLTWVMQNITALVMNVIQAGGSPVRNPEMIEYQIQQIMKKKENMADAFLSDLISKEEFLQMKHKYAAELASLKACLETLKSSEKVNPKKIQSEIYRQVEAIVTCNTRSDSYYKSLLKQFTVHKEGGIEVMLNYLPHTWIFQLESQKCNTNSQ